jgi:ATP-dependent DNA ligase
MLHKSICLQGIRDTQTASGSLIFVAKMHAQDAVIDGEIVALDEKERLSFQLLVAGVSISSRRFAVATSS